MQKKFAQPSLMRQLSTFKQFAIYLYNNFILNHNLLLNNIILLNISTPVVVGAIFTGCNPS